MTTPSAVIWQVSFSDHVTLSLLAFRCWCSSIAPRKQIRHGVGRIKFACTADWTSCQITDSSRQN